MKKVIFFSSLALFIFSGCKAIIETEVSVKNLLASKASIQKSDLLIEVAGCKSYEDSRKDSNALLKAKEIIPAIFKNAKYKECFSKEMESYANFVIPIQVGTANPAKGKVSLLSNKENMMYISIPSHINKKIKEVERREMSSISKMSINIKLHNDTAKKISFKVLSSYVDNVPYIYREYSLDKGKHIYILLSDTSSDEALKYNQSIVLKY